MIAITVVLGLAIYRYLQPVPELSVAGQVAASYVPVPGEASLTWPRRGAAAVAIEGLGQVAANGDEQARPIASVTKMMTAYVILKERPLQIGQQGPLITLNAADVEEYNLMFRQDQSVIAVRQGVQISQYDLLQGLLIASGNNYAYILARWQAGSAEAFVQKMNAAAAALGLSKTRYADPSGFSAASISTASDQLILIQALMQNPVFAEIAGKRQATLPVAGMVNAVNAVLGQAGIIAGKTGFTDEAGGCFVFVSRAQIGGRDVLLFGAVFGQLTRPDAFAASLSLIPEITAALKPVNLITANAVVAEIHSAWGDSAQAVAAADIAAQVWPGSVVRSELQLDHLEAPLGQGGVIGSLLIGAGERSWSVPVLAETGLKEPGFFWRLSR